MTVNKDLISILLNLSNNYAKLLNTLSYIFRFLNNCRNKNKMGGPLNVDEVVSSERRLISLVQQETLSEDFIRLSLEKQVSNRSCLKFLSPFIDSYKVIRVGGRLQESNLPYDSKHPMVLPRAIDCLT